MQKGEKHIIRMLLVVGLAFLIFLTLSGGILIPLTDEPPMQFDLGLNDFEKFAIIVSMGAEALPSVIKQFYSAGAIGIKLLMQGFSPIIFVILLAVGQLIGQMLLYVVGMFSKKVHKGSIGDLASKSHFLHQHHFLIYLAVPFASILGDAVMLYSGHQRINPIKIIPFLLASNIADNTRWVVTQMGNLELSNQFN